MEKLNVFSGELETFPSVSTPLSKVLQKKALRITTNYDSFLALKQPILLFWNLLVLKGLSHEMDLAFDDMNG